MKTASALPAPLLWALVASAAVHTAFVVLPLGAPGNRAGAITNAGTSLQAALVPAVASAPETVPEQTAAVAISADASPVHIEREAVSVPEQKVASVANALASQPPASAGGVVDLRIDGQPLQNRDRLGELQSRVLTEFPVEVDFPARLKEAIRARYPPAALAEGREDSVAVWIVVDASGAPEEITVTEGSEEFADAVVAAIKDTQFLPARNNLQPIRFPLALEFRFAINTPALAGVKATDN